MVEPRRGFSKCSESLDKHSPLDGHGRCSWCGEIVAAPAPKPDLENWVSECYLAYSYHYDPDYGTWPNGPYY